MPLNRGLQVCGRDTWFIPNGVNRPEIRKAELITQKFGLTENSYILFLGRLVPEKGIRYLIEAFKNVCTDEKCFDFYRTGNLSDGTEYCHFCATVFKG